MGARAAPDTATNRLLEWPARPAVSVHLESAPSGRQGFDAGDASSSGWEEGFPAISVFSSKPQSAGYIAGTYESDQSVTEFSTQLAAFQDAAFGLASHKSALMGDITSDELERIDALAETSTVQPVWPSSAGASQGWGQSNSREWVGQAAIVDIMPAQDAPSAWGGLAWGDAARASIVLLQASVEDNDGAVTSSGTLGIIAQSRKVMVSVDGSEDEDHRPRLAPWWRGGDNGTGNGTEPDMPVVDAVDNETSPFNETGWWPADYERIDAIRLPFVCSPGAFLAIRRPTLLNVAGPGVPTTDGTPDGKLGPAAIAGIVIGAVALVAIVVVMVVYRGEIGRAVAGDSNDRAQKIADASNTRALPAASVRRGDMKKLENPMWGPGSSKSDAEDGDAPLR